MSPIGTFKIISPLLGNPLVMLIDKLIVAYLTSDNRRFNFFFNFQNEISRQS